MIITLPNTCTREGNVGEVHRGSGTVLSRSGSRQRKGDAHIYRWNSLTRTDCCYISYRIDHSPPFYCYLLQDWGLIHTDTSASTSTCTSPCPGYNKHEFACIAMTAVHTNTSSIESGWRVNSTRTSSFCAGPVFIQLVENGGQESYRKVISRWKRKTNQTCWKVSGHILISGIGLVVILFQRHERRIEAYYCEHSTLRITSAYTWYYLLIPSRQHCWRHWRHYGVGLRC